MLTQLEARDAMRMISFVLADGFSQAPTVLAMGSELKSSFCLLKNGQAQLSRASGDLEQTEVFRAYCNEMEQSCAEQSFSPEHIAVDMHPDYLSTQMGGRLSERYGCAITRVQHHHAHIAACLAEYSYPLDAAPVLGVALDGLGFGEDGSIWGGEFLLADYTGFTRMGSFQPIAMPGGIQAIREPWRNTLAHLHACDRNDLAERFAHTDIFRFLQRKPLPVLHAMLDKGLNSPLASSAGRLFDAVAACLDVHRERVSSEGQAAIELERMATSVFADATSSYPFTTVQASFDGVIQLGWAPMWQALLTDVEQNTSRELIAARFHRTVIEAVSKLARNLCAQHALQGVALSGGVFQNRLLRNGVAQQLIEHGLSVLIPRQAPLNDGGLALGQAVVAAANILKRKSNA